MCMCSSLRFACKGIVVKLVHVLQTLSDSIILHELKHVLGGGGGLFHFLDVSLSSLVSVNQDSACFLLYNKNYSSKGNDVLSIHGV